MNIDFKNVPKHYASRTHEKMQEVLMDPNGVGPATHYYMIRGGVHQKNTTVWEPGTISGEYIKTYGHYHIGDLSETHTIAYGQGVALLQKLAEDENGKMIPDVVAEFKGPSPSLPAKRFLCLLNSDISWSTPGVLISSPLMTVRSILKNAIPPASQDMPIMSWSKMRGFAYYVVEHEGKPALKKNPLYETIQQEELNGLPVIN